MGIKLNRGQYLVLIFTIIYLVAFSAYYLSIKNYEFLWYILVILIFFGLILFTINRSDFDHIILGGLSLWGLLHLAGGGVPVKGDVLYNLELLPLFKIAGSTVLKYDQVVHAFGFGISALVVFHLLFPYLNRQSNWKIIYPITVAAAAGLGALNEMVEFIAVVTFPDTNVGGYANTALDITFNFIGAILMVIFINLGNYRNHKQLTAS